jgi:hypothetical protein
MAVENNELITTTITAVKRIIVQAPSLSVSDEEKLSILTKEGTKVKLGMLFVRVSPMKDFYFHFVLFWS